MDAASSGDEPAPAHGPRQGGPAAPAARLAASLALVVAAAAFLLLPALGRVPAADQLAYLAELDGDRSLAAGLRLLDYGRVRQFNRGDEVLYRPLLLAVLAVEHTLFGPSHRAWNSVGVVAHAATSGLLLLWLARRLPLPFAILLALCFALSPGGVELAAWHHLLGYLLAGLAWLVALHALDRVDASPLAWLAFAAAGSVAVFLYEISLVALVAFGLAGLYRTRGGTGGRRSLAWLAIAIPPLVYGLAYLARVPAQERLLYVNAHGGPELALPARAAHVGIAFLGQSLAPTLFERDVAPYRRTLTRPDPEASLGAPLLLAALLGAAVATASSRHRLAGAWPLLGAILLTAGAHVSAVAVGRDLGSVWMSGYHVSLFQLLLVLGLGAVLDPSRLAASRWRRAFTLVSLAAWLATMVAVSVPLVLDYRRENAPAEAYLRELRELGRRHPGRRIEQVALPADVDPLRPLVLGYPAPGARGIRVPASRIILPEIYRREGPPLRVRWTGRGFVEEPAAGTPRGPR